MGIHQNGKENNTEVATFWPISNIGSIFQMSHPPASPYRFSLRGTRSPQEAAASWSGAGTAHDESGTLGHRRLETNRISQKDTGTARWPKLANLSTEV